MYVSRVIILLFWLLVKVEANPQVSSFICRASDNNVDGPDIEVSRASTSRMFSCSERQCMQCLWYRFAAGFTQPIGNGSTFNWTKAELDYGQFNCIRTDRTVARKVLILPLGKELCIATYVRMHVCMQVWLQINKAVYI